MTPPRTRPADRGALAIALLLLGAGCLPKTSDRDPGDEAGGAGAGGGAGSLGGHAGHHPTSDAGADAGAPGGDSAAPGDAPADVPPALSAEERAIAGQLEGGFLEVDCASEEIEFQFCHPKNQGIDDVKLAFGGEPGKTYQVVLGVWAVVEGIKYAGGSKAGEHFYIGGASTTPGTAEYGLTVGTGPSSETYHLNHFEVGQGEHYTYGIHYTTPPLSLPGAAALSLYVHDPDNFMNTNHMQSEAEDPPPGLLEKLAVIHAHPPEGQFVYIEVLSARLVQ